MEIIIKSQKYGDKILFLDEKDLNLFEGRTISLQKGKTTFYAKVQNYKNGKSVAVHRIITQCPSGLLVDHINHNGLDNRRDNLRIATPRQNTQNQLPHKDSISRFKGITWVPKEKKWYVQIRSSGKTGYNGAFRCEINAAKKYNELAVKHYGEFAYLNVFTEDDEKNQLIEKEPERGKNIRNKSGYRGVCWNKDKKKWQATIMINRKKTIIGRFDTKEQAANAYITFFKIKFGEEPYKI